MKNPWIITGLLAVVLFGGAIWYSNYVNSQNNVGVEEVSHVLGNPDAEVTLVEYSDLQCPACASFQPVVDEVVEVYGDRIRFEYRHFPLPIHPYANDAALAAEAAAQQGEFFAYANLLFSNQSQWSNSSNPQGFFESYAEELNLDIDEFKRHQDSSILKDKVRSDTNEGRELGVNATPTFFLNGEKMNIETYEDFIMQVAAAVGASTTVAVAE